ncbi:hypothetical protein QCA50_011134 [Cerrena zonata]|uniref:Uncharacterized protein n=1 Tax=Cerrena zonata TaxID=2478898 RepID=A0AAW0G715_9APHY
MSIAPSHMIQGGELRSYDHPFIVTASYKERDKSEGVPLGKKSLDIWKYNDHTTKPIYISTLQGDFPDKLGLTVFINNYLSITSPSVDHKNCLLVYRIEDGVLTSCMTLDGASGDRVPSNFPDQSQVYHLPTIQPGDAAYLASANGLIAVFRIGPHFKAEDTIVEVYGISDDGKFVLKNELHLNSDHPLVLSWSPTTWQTPHLIHLSETEFPSYTRLRASLEVDKDEEELYASSLKANVYFSSLSAFITAHEEGYAVEESSPSTSIRSIDANTLELNWCTSLDHGILSLDAYEPLGLLIVFGRDQVTFYINVLDLQTGAVRRVKEAESATSFPIVRVSPEGELTLVRYDGEIVVILLSDFAEHGYPFSEDSEDSDSEDTKTDVHDEHVIAHILPFDLPSRECEKACERY